MPDMRALTLGLACGVCCAACGGRTSGLDTIGATGEEGGTGGTLAAGGAVDAAGGSIVTNGTGGKGVVPTGGAMSATGGKGVVPTGGVMNATGGKGATMGGSGAMTATGGKGVVPTGGVMNATGGKGATMGGSGAMTATGGSGATKATGGSSATKATGGSSAASGGTVGTGGTSSAIITTCDGSFPFLGTWEGNILDFYFEPTEALKLELSADASGTITGKLTWGSGAPPPAPQGADIPYPPGYWDQQTKLGYVATPDPWPGFAYTIVRGAVCDTTFRFGVSTYEIWQDWCKLQTAINSGSFGWGCTLRGGSGSTNGTTCTIYAQNGGSQTYPLWKCNACGAFRGINSGVCSCDQNGCFSNPTATQTFDLTYSASGTTQILSGPDPSCGDCTVRLERKN